MEIELSAHVRLRIGQRHLDLGWLERIVNHPEWREPGPSDSTLERRFGPIEEMGGRVLRVVVLPISPTKCRIVTAFFDRGARKRKER
ncbi:MAG: DUF4258 domain-containing protein [Microvirga sp.]